MHFHMLANILFC